MEYNQLCKRLNGEGSFSNSTESKSLVHIPQEIIEDILIRLPGKPLCRFKCVSQSWNSLISNIKFHTGSVLTIYTSSEGRFFNSKTEQGTSTKKFPVPWDRSRTSREAYVSNSCNGMVLICVDTCFYLFNPSTHYFVKVLTLNYTCYGCDEYDVSIGLYYDESICDFTAVVLVRYGINHNTVVLLVETSLKGKQWNKVGHTFEHYTHITVGPVVNGRIHWLVKKRINRFDPVLKVFEELPSFQPPPNHTKSKIVGIGILEGCLCVSRLFNENNVEILAMKEYGVYESWTPIFSFSHERLDQYTRDCNPLLQTRAGEVLISMDSEIWVYNLGEKSFEEYQESSTCPVSFVQNMDTLTGYYWNQTEHESFGNTKYFKRIYNFWEDMARSGSASYGLELRVKRRRINSKTISY